MTPLCLEQVRDRVRAEVDLVFLTLTLKLLSFSNDSVKQLKWQEMHSLIG